MPRKSRSGQQPLRLFLAIYPPPPVVDALLKNLRAIPHLPPYREILPDQIHLTLHFLGNIKSRDLDTTIETIDRAKKTIHQFNLTPHTLCAYPRFKTPAPKITRNPRTLPRLIAAETNAPPDLLHLHERLVKRLTTKPPRKNPSDKYHPHLTLCRFRSYRAAEYDLPNLNWVTPGLPLPPSQSQTFTVTNFALVKSTLQPAGPTHENIATWPLSPTKNNHHSKEK